MYKGLCRVNIIAIEDVLATQYELSFSSVLSWVDPYLHGFFNLQFYTWIYHIMAIGHIML